MPLELTTLLAFAGAAALISLAPGPDMLFVLTNGLRHGPRGGVAAALGVSAGMLTHTALAVAGLSALIASSAAVFEALKIAGAVYLVVLAVMALRSRGEDAAEATGTSGRTSLLRLGRQGALTNLLNPKVIVFYLAFLPQFVDREAGGVTFQLLVLGVVFTAVGLAIDASVGLFSGRLGDRLGRSLRLRRWIDRLAAGVFAGLAVRLISE